MKACYDFIAITGVIVTHTTFSLVPSFLPNRRFGPGNNTYGTSKVGNGESKTLEPYKAGNIGEKG